MDKRIKLPGYKKVGYFEYIAFPGEKICKEANCGFENEYYIKTKNIEYTPIRIRDIFGQYKFVLYKTGNIELFNNKTNEVFFIPKEKSYLILSLADQIKKMKNKKEI